MSRYINRPFDDDFCFFIQDFNVGDSIIIKGPKRQKIKAVVNKIDKTTNEIICLAKNQSIHTVGLNSVVYLDDPQDGWIDD